MANKPLPPKGAKGDFVVPPRPGVRDSRSDSTPVPPLPKSKYSLKNLPPPVHSNRNVGKAGNTLTGLDADSVRFQETRHPTPESFPKSSYNSTSIKEQSSLAPPVSPTSIPPTSSGSSGTMRLDIGGNNGFKASISKSIWQKIYPVLIWFVGPSVLGIGGAAIGYIEGKAKGYKDMIADIEGIKTKQIVKEREFAAFKELNNGDINGAYAKTAELNKKFDNFIKREFEPLKAKVEEGTPMIQGLPPSAKKK